MALLFDWFLRGGPLMWPLLVASVLAVALWLERVMAQRGLLAGLAGAADDLRLGWRSGGREGLRRAGARHGGAVADLAERAADSLNLPPDLAAEAVRARVGELGRRGLVSVRWLDGLAVVGPLLGLTGTLIGWAGVLEGMTRRGSADLTVIGGELAEAIVTSVFGLLVGLEAWALGHVVAGRAERVESELRQLAPTLLAVVREAVPELPPPTEPAPEPEPEDEPFDPADELDS